MAATDRRVGGQLFRDLFGDAAWFTEAMSQGPYDRTLLASAARTTTQTSADLVNASGRGILVIFDATAVTAGASLVLTIDGKDPTSGKYYTLLTGVAVTAESTNVYRIYPGADLTSGQQIVDTSLPYLFRIVVTAADAKSVTYSVGYTLLP